MSRCSRYIHGNSRQWRNDAFLSMASEWCKRRNQQQYVYLYYIGHRVGCSLHNDIERSVSDSNNGNVEPDNNHDYDER